MITLTDLIDRFGESELANLSDKDNYRLINETVINHAINDALAIIQSYLNPTGMIRQGADGKLIYVGQLCPSSSHQNPYDDPYSNPYGHQAIGQVPKALILKACDIARFYLYDDGVTEIVQKRYDDAIAWLKMVSTNPAMLTGVATSNKGQSGIYVISSATPSLYDTDKHCSWEM